MLTPEQRALRADKITGSFAPWLMAGDEDRILAVWRELVGDPAWTPEDFSDNWQMALGSHVEALALDWQERRNKAEIVRRGEVVFHPTRPYVAATLDGYRPADRAVLDAKWIDARRNLDEALAFYTPQLVVQRACVPEAQYAALVAVHGGAEPQELFANITADYEALVWERIDAFQRCVETLTPPFPIAPAPPPPERWRKINLDVEADAHNWSADMIAQCKTWLQTTAAGKLNAEATKAIKAMLPDDCGELRTGPVIIKRNRARAVSITEAR